MCSSSGIVHALCLSLLALSASLIIGCAASEDVSNDVSEDDLVATFNVKANIDLSKPTRILLVGDSSHLGSLPLYSATGKAKRYAQLYPNEQVVLSITKDASKDDVARTGSTLVTSEPFGDAVALSDLRRLSTDKLILALDRFSKISSLEFFGHSSPFGALTEGEGASRVLSAALPGNASILKDNFDRSGVPYVTLNGCNGAVETAAKLSKIWEVPVSGALTASNFQTLKSDNHFYVDEPGFYPEELRNASSNAVSFREPLRCSGGACIRMKPQDAPYWGVWSNQETGMQYGAGHYKFFCDYTDTNKSCVRGMAASLFGFTGEKDIDERASEADVKEVLADFFCTRSKDSSWFDTCKANLENAVATGTPFSPMRSRNDYTLECDFKKCEQQFRCTIVSGVPQKKTCAWVAAGCPEGAAPNSSKCFVKNSKKQMAATEYKAYLEGFALLGNMPAPPVTLKIPHRL
jgi:hypothetical protein